MPFNIKRKESKATRVIFNVMFFKGEKSKRWDELSVLL